MSDEVCARRGCYKDVPTATRWHKEASHKHCSWVCYYEDAYDVAERDAASEGLTGDQWRRRASALFLERDAERKPMGRPRKVADVGAGATP